MTQTHSAKEMTLRLKVWRQSGPKEKGRLVEYTAESVSPDMSFLEMLDVVNEGLIKKGEEPIAFDHDCREGICGSCGLMVNGVAHGPDEGASACQVHMRSFQDGQTLVIEPWRARAFPVVKDLVVNRSAFDRIIAAGGYIRWAPAPAPTPTPFPFPKTPAKTRWTPPPASVAAPASRNAKTPAPRFLLLLKSATSAACHKGLSSVDTEYSR